MSTLGARLVSADEGSAAIACWITDGLTQQHGYAHAGVMASIADSACGYAALSVMPEGCEVVSVEFKLNMLRPCTAGEIVAEGTVVKSGKTLVFTEGRVMGADGSGPFATMTATMFCVKPGS